MVDFRYFLNRQGARGIKGETGNEGFSPAITVEADTINEYTLRIITKSDNFVTPNLKMPINNTGGSYLRFNQETGEVSAAFLDNATETELGGIVIASQEDVNAGEDTAKAVTPRTLYEYVNPIIADAARLSQANNFTGINRFKNIVRFDSPENNFVGNSSKLIKEIDDGSAFLKEYTYLHQGSVVGDDYIQVTKDGDNINLSTQNLAKLDQMNSFMADVSVNGHIVSDSITIKDGTVSSDGTLKKLFISLSPMFKAEYNYLHQGSIEAGDNITIEQTTEGIKISSTGGSGTGDVTAAGNNTFTGTNTFNNNATFNNPVEFTDNVDFRGVTVTHAGITAKQIGSADGYMVFSNINNAPTELAFGDTTANITVRSAGDIKAVVNGSIETTIATDVDLQIVRNEINTVVEDVSDLQTQVGNISTVLDQINGEVI